MFDHEHTNASSPGYRVRTSCHPFDEAVIGQCLDCGRWPNAAARRVVLQNPEAKQCAVPVLGEVMREHAVAEKQYGVAIGGGGQTGSGSLRVRQQVKYRHGSIRQDNVVVGDQFADFSAAGEPHLQRDVIDANP